MRENGSLNFYRNLMKRDVPVDRNKTAPKCRQCCYYHPDFKYRKVDYDRIHAVQHRRICFLVVFFRGHTVLI